MGILDHTFILKIQTGMEQKQGISSGFDPGAQRKNSLSDSWMDGSECKYWPDR